VQTRPRGGAPPELSRVASDVEAFPALRQAREALLDKLRDDDLHGAAAAIERSVALTLAVLRTANRPVESRGKVESATQAVECIPRGTLVATAESVPVYDPLDGSRRWDHLPEHVEGHAGSVRTVTVRLAGELGIEDPGPLATAALIHDVGKIAVTITHGKTASDLYLESHAPDHMLMEERRRLGTDHAAAGARLLRAWHVPDGMIATVEAHHDHDASGGAAIVRLADMLVHYSQGRPTDLDQLSSMSTSLGMKRQALSDLMYELPQPSSPQRREARPCPLTDRELDVLRLLSEGKVYKQIATELGLSPSTVRSHLHRAYNRIGATDRAQAVLIATDAGWL
jgi:putative nucleotidyltransferase with HDIG domain